MKTVMNHVINIAAFVAGVAFFKMFGVIGLMFVVAGVVGYVLSRKAA